MKYIDTEKLITEIKRLKWQLIRGACSAQIEMETNCKDEAYNEVLSSITALQQEQLDEQPEYGYLSTEYVHGKKPRWSVGDVLAYYICTSNEEGEYVLGKIVNVEFDEEDGWVYTLEDESTWDEQSLVEEEAYKKLKWKIN